MSDELKQAREKIKVVQHNCDGIDYAGLTTLDDTINLPAQSKQLDLAYCTINECNRQIADFTARFMSQDERIAELLVEKDDLTAENKRLKKAVDTYIKKEGE